ncbi:uncharacterized protein LY89DRAFT_735956 [Mollisia scopiformis]|uniref:BTB domain transcription factor n=1 Tax=Mollisia scopiformis TaxID=149040 RepID=A0A194X3Y3_MOLSC|nr:uncharacterized protein LY89DRAFT_735956 [Mollisia scopiformis]KUJ14895.1 hypothetical protein LY89DRAFT_735956 [Mollisia scopiformis]
MARTRSSRDSAKSTPQSATKAGSKRSAGPSASPPRKRGRPSKKEQKTIEETMDIADDQIEDDKDVAEQINDDATTERKSESKEIMNGHHQEHNGNDDATKNESKTANGLNDGEKNAFDEIKGDANEVKEAAKEEQDKKTEDIAQHNESVITDEKREAAIPSSILEKGVVYFFFRGRVGVEDPQGIEDVARSYLVLRPLPLGAKIGEGPLEDSGNARLLALPKKMLPKNKQDRFLMFVEKTNQFIKDLREQFAGNEYATKTSGTSNTPAATPFAEGIYAITSTGRESHLAYHITVPEKIGEVQKELGINLKGSYVVSAKNPNAPGPANATLSNPAQYPESIQKKFRNLRWMPLEPELLNYENTQFLVIGEGMGDTGRATEEMSKDKKDDEKETPSEELEKLEEEDHDRVEGLKEDDPVFADLGLSSKEYHKLQTTW